MFRKQHFLHEQQSEGCALIGDMDLGFALFGKGMLFSREHASALIAEKEPHCVCVDGRIMEFVPTVDDIMTALQSLYRL